MPAKLGHNNLFKKEAHCRPQPTPLDVRHSTGPGVFSLLLPLLSASSTTYTKGKLTTTMSNNLVDFVPAIMTHEPGDDENDSQDLSPNLPQNYRITSLSRSVSRDSSIQSGSVFSYQRDTSFRSHDADVSVVGGANSTDDDSSVMGSVASGTRSVFSRASAGVASRHHRAPHPWESGGDPLSKTSATVHRSEHGARKPWGGSGASVNADFDTGYARAKANSFTRTNKNETMNLSTRSTQTRTRYSTTTATATRHKGQEAHSEGFSFTTSDPVQLKRSQSHSPPPSEAITASSVLSSLLGFASESESEKKFYRDSSDDDMSEKKSSIYSLFRLQEEEVEDDFEHHRIKEGIELSRKNNKPTRKTAYEVDNPRSSTLVVRPDVELNGISAGGDGWKTAKLGQELDEDSDSGSHGDTSIDSLDELLHPELVEEHPERVIHIEQESIASLEASLAQLDAEFDNMESSQVIREEAEEQLNNLDHAEAVINTFNQILEQEEEEQRQLDIAMQESLPSLHSIGSLLEDLPSDDDENANLALREYVIDFMDSMDYTFNHPPKSKLTDLFHWSDKKNVDKVERTKQKRVAQNPSKKGLHVSPADVLFQRDGETNTLSGAASIETDSDTNHSRGGWIKIGGAMVRRQNEVSTRRRSLQTRSPIVPNLRDQPKSDAKVAGRKKENEMRRSSLQAASAPLAPVAPDSKMARRYNQGAMRRRSSEAEPIHVLARDHAKPVASMGKELLMGNIKTEKEVAISEHIAFDYLSTKPNVRTSRGLHVTTIRDANECDDTIGKKEEEIRPDRRNEELRPTSMKEKEPPPRRPHEHRNTSTIAQDSIKVAKHHRDSVRKRPDTHANHEIPAIPADRNKLESSKSKLPVITRRRSSLKNGYMNSRISNPDQEERVTFSGSVRFLNAEGAIEKIQNLDQSVDNDVNEKKQLTKETQGRGAASAKIPGSMTKSRNESKRYDGESNRIENNLVPIVTDEGTGTMVQASELCKSEPLRLGTYTSAQDRSKNTPPSAIPNDAGAPALAKCTEGHKSEGIRLPTAIKGEQRESIPASIATDAGGVSSTPVKEIRKLESCDQPVTLTIEVKRQKIILPSDEGAASTVISDPKKSECVKSRTRNENKGRESIPASIVTSDEGDIFSEGLGRQKPDPVQRKTYTAVANLKEETGQSGKRESGSSSETSLIASANGSTRSSSSSRGPDMDDTNKPTFKKGDISSNEARGTSRGSHRRSKRDQTSQQKLKPDLVTAFNKSSSSFRRADIENRGTEQVGSPVVKDKVTKKKSCKGDLSGISPEEVMAALMGGSLSKVPEPTTKAGPPALSGSEELMLLPNVRSSDRSSHDRSSHRKRKKKATLERAVSSESRASRVCSRDTSPVQRREKSSATKSRGVEGSVELRSSECSFHRRMGSSEMPVTSTSVPSFDRSSHDRSSHRRRKKTPLERKASLESQATKVLSTDSSPAQRLEKSHVPKSREVTASVANRSSESSSHRRMARLAPSAASPTVRSFDHSSHNRSSHRRRKKKTASERSVSSESRVSRGLPKDRSPTHGAANTSATTDLDVEGSVGPRSLDRSPQRRLGGSKRPVASPSARSSDRSHNLSFHERTSKKVTLKRSLSLESRTSSVLSQDDCRESKSRGVEAPSGSRPSNRNATSQATLTDRVVSSKSAEGKVSAREKSSDTVTSLSASDAKDAEPFVKLRSSNKRNGIRRPTSVEREDALERRASLASSTIAMPQHRTVLPPTMTTEAAASKASMQPRESSKIGTEVKVSTASIEVLTRKSSSAEKKKTALVASVKSISSQAIQQQNAKVEATNINITPNKTDIASLPVVKTSRKVRRAKSTDLVGSSSGSKANLNGRHRSPKRALSRLRKAPDPRLAQSLHDGSVRSRRSTINKDERSDDDDSIDVSKPIFRKAPSRRRRPSVKSIEVTPTSTDSQATTASTQSGGRKIGASNSIPQILSTEKKIKSGREGALSSRSTNPSALNGKPAATLSGDKRTHGRRSNSVPPDVNSRQASTLARKSTRSADLSKTKRKKRTS